LKARRQDERQVADIELIETREVEDYVLRGA
jgi:hypothetical protein